MRDQTQSEQSDSDYGNAVVVTVTFKGADRMSKAALLERYGVQNLGGAAFVEQVEIDEDRRS